MFVRSKQSIVTVRGGESAGGGFYVDRPSLEDYYYGDPRPLKETGYGEFMAW